MTIIEQAEEEIAIFERPSVQTSKKLIAKMKELELALENTQQRLSLMEAHVQTARPMVEAYRSHLGGALWSLDNEIAQRAEEAELWLGDTEGQTT